MLNRLNALGQDFGIRVLDFINTLFDFIIKLSTFHSPFAVGRRQDETDEVIGLIENANMNSSKHELNF